MVPLRGPGLSSLSQQRSECPFCKEKMYASQLRTHCIKCDKGPNRSSSTAASAPNRPKQPLVDRDTDVPRKGPLRITSPISAQVPTGSGIGRPQAPTGVKGISRASPTDARRQDGVEKRREGEREIEALIVADATSEHQTRMARSPPAALSSKMHLLARSPPKSLPASYPKRVTETDSDRDTHPKRVSPIVPIVPIIPHGQGERERGGAEAPLSAREQARAASLRQQPFQRLSNASETPLQPPPSAPHQSPFRPLSHSPSTVSAVASVDVQVEEVVQTGGEREREGQKDDMDEEYKDISADLVGCPKCGRTMLPGPLKRHMVKCGKPQRRNTFSSGAKRYQGMQDEERALVNPLPSVSNNAQVSRPVIPLRREVSKPTIKATSAVTKPPKASKMNIDELASVGSAATRDVPRMVMQHSPPRASVVRESTVPVQSSTDREREAEREREREKDLERERSIMEEADRSRVKEEEREREREREEGSPRDEYRASRSRDRERERESRGSRRDVRTERSSDRHREKERDRERERRHRHRSKGEREREGDRDRVSRSRHSRHRDREGERERENRRHSRDSERDRGRDRERDSERHRSKDKGRRREREKVDRRGERLPYVPPQNPSYDETPVVRERRREREREYGDYRHHHHHQHRPVLPPSNLPQYHRDRGHREREYRGREREEVSRHSSHAPSPYNPIPSLVASLGDAQCQYCVCCGSKFHMDAQYCGHCGNHRRLYDGTTVAEEREVERERPRESVGYRQYAHPAMREREREREYPPSDMREREREYPQWGTDVQQESEDTVRRLAVSNTEADRGPYERERDRQYPPHPQYPQREDREREQPYYGGYRDVYQGQRERGLEEERQTDLRQRERERYHGAGAGGDARVPGFAAYGGQGYGGYT
ncbi:hypothetical protein KIPB_000344 [Kipferlia bialata]|uniref:Uncharacterized protein n=1 Tax=Kipferlia bialata TaxID=797122 RepID=A0A9K3CNE5_9EUKA|nr:hypothetical protein KIPB_000344 [Kipferlia bialata]|eukprot:g344.t1